MEKDAAEIITHHIAKMVNATKDARIRAEEENAKLGVNYIIAIVTVSASWHLLMMKFLIMIITNCKLVLYFFQMNVQIT